MRINLNTMRLSSLVTMAAVVLAAVAGGSPLFG
jgi:hypothetical protein